MWRILGLGFALGILAAIAAPILFRYTNILISLAVFFAVLISIVIVILVAAGIYGLYDPERLKRARQSFVQWIRFSLRYPDRAGEFMRRRTSQLVPLLLPFILQLGAISVVTALLGAAAGLSLILVGLQQVERLDQQNEILQTQLPLLLRQSISAYETEIRTKRRSLDDANEALITLQDWKTSAEPMSWQEPDAYCADLSANPTVATPNCDQLKALSLSDAQSDEALPSSPETMAFLSYFTNAALERRQRWGLALTISRRQTDEQFQRDSGLHDVVVKCQTETGLGQQFMRSVTDDRRWEDVIGGSSAFMADAGEMSKVEYAEAMTRLYRPAETLGFAELISALVERDHSQVSLWERFERDCLSKVQTASQELAALTAARDADIAQLTTIRRRTSTD